MPKKKPKTKPNPYARNAKEDAACAEFAAALSKLAGFEVTVEPVRGFCFRAGGAISLNTMTEIVQRLTGKDAK